MHKIPIGVLGASGYAGRELCGLIAKHPRLSLAFASANEQRGQQARFGGESVTFIATDDAPLERAELIFSALPHGASAVWVYRARSAGAKVVDLSADLRPGNADINAPYGLPEAGREGLADASVIANPGCYPTAILLGLLPLLSRGLVNPEGTITVNAASGVTGAGFSPKTELLFGEVTEDFRPYAAGNNHRHLGEMRAKLAEMRCEADLILTPHLLPVARGIVATMTVPLREPLEDPLRYWQTDYADEPFIEITPELPALKDVVRRNVARITALTVANVRHPTLLVVSAIDNLVKGAAGQAVQNANIVLGLPEPMGLPA